MSAGRGKLIVGVIVLAAACAAAPAASALAGGPKAHLAGKGKHRPKYVFLKAKVIADGYLTPGQPETIRVKRMAPRARIKVFIEAPPTTVQCGERYFCDPAPVFPAPGYPRFHASGKGRALLTFVMPDSYYLEIDPFDPSKQMPVTFADQQRVHIDVEGASRTKRVKRQSFGFARATVQLPPS